MQYLKDRIVKDGKVLGGDVLKVDSFLNHQLDSEVLAKMAEAFFDYFAPKGVNKILTIEASGIGIACVTAQLFKVPTVFAKKSKTSNLGDDVYSSVVHSYTHNVDNHVRVSKDYLGAGDKVLIIDDFLANGCAIDGLADLISQAGAELVGVGICIEKGYQGGGDKLRQKGVDLYSLAIVDKMDENGNISFRE